MPLEFDAAYWSAIASKGSVAFADACERYLRMKGSGHEKLRAFALARFTGWALSEVLAAIDRASPSFIRVNLSNAFHNKTIIQGDTRAFGNSFEPCEVTISDFVKHVGEGRAFTLGYFQGNTRRKETFISGQLLGLDLDNGVSVADALKHPSIAQFALLVYATPSSTPEHPKTRVIFVLSEAVEGFEQWEALQIALLQEFADLEPDEKCKDAARLFFGSDQDGAHINLKARLPLSIAQTLPTHKPTVVEILRTISPAVKPSEPTAEKPYAVRGDSEVGRLCIALDLKSQLRLACIAHDLNTEQGGSGWLHKEAFRKELEALGINYTERHYRRLLEQGNGLFWWVGETHLKLIAKKLVGAALTKEALRENPALVESNIPGLKRDVLLPVHGSLEQWEALIYAGWIAAKKNPDISRERLAILFNRTVKTIRRWEREHLEGIVTTTPNRAQSADLDAFEETNHYNYEVTVPLPTGGVRLEARTGRQKPNTYHSTIQLHRHRGQARKVLAMSKLALGLQPSDESDGGLKRNTRENWYSAKGLNNAIDKGCEGGHLHIGTDRGGWKVFEPTSDGHQKTHANEHRFTRPGAARYTAYEGGNCV
jgi:hypothetical protein